MLTKIQKEKFLEIACIEYDGKTMRGSFLTKYPYNDKSWSHSPWNFRFQIDTKTGNLYCELSHRMTNNRMYGWNANGDELTLQDIRKIYPNTDPLIAMIDEAEKMQKEQKE